MQKKILLIIDKSLNETSYDFTYKITLDSNNDNLTDVIEQIKTKASNDTESFPYIMLNLHGNLKNHIPYIQIEKKIEDVNTFLKTIDDTIKTINNKDRTYIIISCNTAGKDLYQHLINNENSPIKAIITIGSGKKSIYNKEVNNYLEKIDSTCIEKNFETKEDMFFHAIVSNASTIHLYSYENDSYKSYKFKIKSLNNINTIDDWKESLLNTEFIAYNTDTNGKIIEEKIDKKNPIYNKFKIHLNKYTPEELNRLHKNYLKKLMFLCMSKGKTERLEALINQNIHKKINFDFDLTINSMLFAKIDLTNVIDFLISYNIKCNSHEIKKYSLQKLQKDCSIEDVDSILDGSSNTYLLISACQISNKICKHIIENYDNITWFFFQNASISNKKLSRYLLSDNIFPILYEKIDFNDSIALENYKTNFPPQLYTSLTYAIRKHTININKNIGTKPDIPPIATKQTKTPLLQNKDPVTIPTPNTPSPQMKSLKDEEKATSLLQKIIEFLRSCLDKVKSFLQFILNIPSKIPSKLFNITTYSANTNKSHNII